MLKEPRERMRELDAHEAVALDAAVRKDYALWFQFTRLTALRLDETIIKWEHVNTFAKVIRRPGKGGRMVSTPITPTVAAILEQCRGHHPEYVFTYVCRRTVKNRGLVRGERYPLTYEGIKTEWQRLRKRSGVKDFRFHDIRHDTATKLLRKTGNLPLVQKTLNHSDIKTTSRYAHVMHEDVADALEALAKSHDKPHDIDISAA